MLKQKPKQNPEKNPNSLLFSDALNSALDNISMPESTQFALNEVFSSLILKNNIPNNLDIYSTEKEIIAKTTENIAELSENIV